VSDDPAALEQLLEHLKSTRGFDFTGYKRPSLERRLAKRMGELGIEDYTTYLDHLEVQPDEFGQLFDTLLINVTSFFRDEAPWGFLQSTVLPELLARRPDGPIRAWVAGCASGEEAYTLAMLLAERLGVDDYARRVKIYATDVDDDALDSARGATYEPKAVGPVPERLRERYLERVDGRVAVCQELRRNVIFGRNDLVQDAPISRVDLLVCRNTLMYFTAETQARILRRFHFALKPDGLLFLGKSEMLLTHGDLFVPVSLKDRVFRRVGVESLRDRLLATADGGDGVPDDAAAQRIRERAFVAGPVAQVVLDLANRVVLVNERARTLLGLGPADVGRRLPDLELSYRPVELRPHIDRAHDRREDVVANVRGVRTRGEADRDLQVRVTPLLADGEVVGTSISYLDLTGEHEVQAELERSRRDLATAYEELQSMVEELETTNEELQSTNEELQSTNEELETMNEELQSTNEELETMNDELRTRTNELHEINAVTEAIMGSIGVGLVVVDGAGTVRLYNREAEDLWGLRREEALGQHVLALDIGLALGELNAPLRAVLQGDSEREERDLDALDRRGRPLTCRVTLLPLAATAQGGAIVLMERFARGT